MPVRICTIKELTPHGRGRKSTMDSVSEFVEVRMKLANGLKPYEAIEVELPTDHAKSLQGTLKRHIVRLIKKLGLTDYEVQAYRANGKDFIAVSNPTPPPRESRDPVRFAPSNTKAA